LLHVPVGVGVELDADREVVRGGVDAAVVEHLDVAVGVPARPTAVT
jgi:hypothetical protein